MSPSNVNCNSNGGGSCKNYIKHQVSKMDTLAGVAIKYGVEVADVKRLNGLATDLQMFALKTLLIPLPGRHPPSPVLTSTSASPGANGLDKTPPRPRYSNLLESFESLRPKSAEEKVSPAMSTLQKFYGLKSPNPKGAAEGTEMAVYRTGSAGYLNEELLPKSSHISGSSYHNLKSRNSANCLLSDDAIMVDYVPLAEAGDAEGEKSSEKFVRRRQKCEIDFRTGTSERLLKEENSGGSSGFSPATGKGLAMRPKSASRAALTAESEPGWINSIAVGMGDSIITDGLPIVRKSSSTPSLHDQENGNSSSSIWPTSKWNLKTDLQALSNAAITIPIFDGLPKPISGRRSKAALD
ncbi:peptidoglycan-binding LysM domain-containing protein [Euphorbia peplus]|nr:peptidoglycan-binding LysM domain-containing protein [Euphorbia peplus]